MAALDRQAEKWFIFYIDKLCECLKDNSLLVR
jgi:hypothetical protein